MSFPYKNIVVFNHVLILSLSLSFFNKSPRKNTTDIDECAETTGLCAFQCRNLAGSYMCICPRGYRVAADGRMCEDVNECEDKNRCQQRCKNLVGSHMCLCYDGYASIGDRCVGESILFSSSLRG